MMNTQFERYCRKWSTDISKIDDQSGRISYFYEQLPHLLLDHPAVLSILKCMSAGGKWPDLKRSELFRNEVLLYLDKGRRFSVRLYFHPSHSYTHIHDHSSWGVSGTAFGDLSVISYIHNGINENGFAKLHRRYHKILPPGQVDLTYPWDEGIHKTGSVNDTLNVMISIYGRPGRRLYVNCYDEQSGKVERLYPPKLLRRNFAKKAIAIYQRDIPAP